MKIKMTTRVILFLLIGVLLFASVQSIFTPTWESEGGKPNLSLSGFHSLDSNSVDVIFLGNSQVMAGVSPMKIYEEYGITSYDLGTSGQPIECSYWMLRNAFQTQNPVAVFLDVRELYRPDTRDSNASWRYVIDNLPLSKLKLELASDYDQFFYSDGWSSVLFPFFRYHSRWSELTKKDFEPKHKKDLYYTAGTLLSTTVSPASVTLESANEIEASMEARDISGVGISVCDHNLEYLNKIQALCEENGAKLVLMKIPIVAFPQVNTSAWTNKRSEYFHSLAENNGLPFVDLICDANIVDLSRDTQDAGIHLNIRGAEAVASYLGKYIVDNFDLSVKQNAQYDEMLADYQRICHVAKLQMETDFDSYLEILEENKEDWTIVITAQNEYTSSLNTYNTDLFAKLGLTKIQNGVFADSYAAVIEKGEVVYEELSGKRIDYKMQLEHGPSISLCSSGWYSGPYASTKVNGAEYAGNAEGLNIVVYDHESGVVIDSAYCNTRYENSMIRHASAQSKMNMYEAQILK